MDAIATLEPDETTESGDRPDPAQTKMSIRLLNVALTSRGTNGQQSASWILVVGLTDRTSVVWPSLEVGVRYAQASSELSVSGAVAALRGLRKRPNLQRAQVRMQLQRQYSIGRGDRAELLEA